MHIGFIGLGNVGGKLSGSLLRNGIKLSVHELDKGLVNNFVKRGAMDGKHPQRELKISKHFLKMQKIILMQLKSLLKLKYLAFPQAQKEMTLYWWKTHLITSELVINFLIYWH